MSTSLTDKWRSWISTKGTWLPRMSWGLQLLNQKDDFPEPARQEYPFLSTFLALIMDDQVGELLGWASAWRMFGPTAYLLEWRLTHNLFVVCTISQTSFPRRQVVASLAALIHKPPNCFGLATFFQFTGGAPLLFCPLHIKLRVVWSILSQIFWGSQLICM